MSHLIFTPRIISDLRFLVDTSAPNFMARTSVLRRRHVITIETGIRTDSGVRSVLVHRFASRVIGDDQTSLDVAWSEIIGFATCSMDVGTTNPEHIARIVHHLVASGIEVEPLTTATARRDVA